MERIISILDKPCFFSWEDKGSHCSYRDMTAVVEDGEGNFLIGGVDKEDLTSVSELVEAIKELTLYDEVKLGDISDFVKSDMKAGDGALESLAYVIACIAASRQKVNGEVLEYLKRMKKNIDNILNKDIS